MLKLSEKPKLNILVAIPYCNSGVVNALKSIDNCRFYLDSGAFTAWKAGKEITLDYYCNFISSLNIKPWRYFSLDVIGSAKKTKDNFENLKKNGFSPVPVFTRGEKIEELEYYYSQADCVALGGLVGTKNNKNFVRAAMEVIKGRKTHWLGFNKQEFLPYYRPYSSDSSSWLSAIRYASLRFYCGNGKWVLLSKDNFKNKPTSQIIDQFKIYNEDPRRLAFSDEWRANLKGNKLIDVITAKSWTRYQLEVEKKLGVKFFLSCASGTQIELIKNAYLFWVKNYFTT